MISQDCFNEASNTFVHNNYVKLSEKLIKLKTMDDTIESPTVAK